MRAGTRQVRIRRVGAAVSHLETDELTGVLTRRAIAALLDGAGELRSVPIGLLVIDLDGFKEVNDTVGHELGDQVLAEVARRLLEPLADSDLIGRIGGDEFVIVSPRASGEEELAGLAEALKAAVSRQPVCVDRFELEVTVTVGAVRLEPGIGMTAALQEADQRLYLAKRRAGSDVHDRVSELIVGLLEARGDPIETTLASAVAEVAMASRAYVDTSEHESWWPTGEPEQADRYREGAVRARLLDEVVELGWGLAVPLRGDGESIGGFVVAREFPFTKSDRIALSRAGIALGQALLRLKEGTAVRRRIAELEFLAFRDENTGVANRRALLREVERLDANGVPVALMFLDFDGLRDVNNNVSYEQGNELLRAVATEIERGLQGVLAGEFAARLHGSGGDEFIVVCPRVGQEQLVARAAELERRLAPGAFDLPDALARWYGGASVGYAVREHGESVLEFLERAAKLMRTRKAARKASPGEAPASPSA
jgi:diguanylate cyclase (GGDEF)-like protein